MRNASHKTWLHPTLVFRMGLVALVLGGWAGTAVRGQTGGTSGSLVWTARSPMIYAAGSGAVAAGGNGHIYYVGGVPSQYWITQEYDPASDVWSRAADMPTSRYSLAAAAAGGKLYAIGGWNWQNAAYGWYTGATESYDPATSVWARLAPMPTPRQAPAAAAGGNGIIYAAGGTYYYPYVALTVVEAYNPATNSWTTAAPMRTGRWWHAVAGASNGKIYAIGGYDGRMAGSMGSGQFDPAGILDTVEEYDPATNAWTTKAPMPTRRAGLTAVATPDGKIYAIGGFYGASSTNASAALATVEVYDTATDTWTAERPMTTARLVPQAAFVDGVIYVMGGYVGGRFLATVEAATPVVADTLPPRTTATLSGDVGTNGWYRSAVRASLEAMDDGAGVASTFYSLDGAAWVLYGGPFDVAAEGVSTLAYFSTDLAGNREEPARTLEIGIDTRAPTVAFLGNDGTYTAGQYVNIVCDARDGGSGIASTTCRDITGPASAFPLGVNTFSATATDRAGNTGAASTTFTVSAPTNPYDDVRSLIRSFVVKTGIATSLIGKLTNAEAAGLRGDSMAKAGLLKAFVNEVKAQIGKALGAEEAATLIRLVQAL